jgi:hypothetical protein
VKKMTGHLAFYSEIAPADCPCCEGKWAVGVFALLPDKTKMYLGCEMFDQQREAEQAAQSVTKKVALSAVKQMQLQILATDEGEVDTLQDVEKKLSDFRRATDPDLN